MLRSSCQSYVYHSSPNRTKPLLTSMELTSPTAVYVVNLEGTSISLLLLAPASLLGTLYREYNAPRLNVFTTCRVASKAEAPTRQRAALRASTAAVSAGRGTGSGPWGSNVCPSCWFTQYPTEHPAPAPRMVTVSPRVVL